MANTKRGNVLDNLKTVIEGLSSVTACEINSNRALHKLDTSVMPFVNLLSSGTLIAEKTSVALEYWDLEVSVYIVTTAGNAEDIRGDIKEAIMADITRGGHAKNTSYSNDEINPDLDIPSNAQSLTMNIVINYFVEEGKKI